jgi:hypothetical protein
MFNKKISRLMMVPVMGALLLGCGSDSEESSDNVVQFYNASPNRTSASLVLDDYSYTAVDFVEQLSLTLPEDYYEINIVYQADNGTQTLVYQSDSISFDGDSNYTFVLTPDSTSSLGHRLTSL